MGRTIKIDLSDKQHAELEEGYLNGNTHVFRVRCQMILLKAEGRKSQEVADILVFASKRSTAGSGVTKTTASMV